MLKLILNLLIFLLSSSLLKAYEITGFVTDISNKEPIEGVNIYVKELQIGTVSDQNGNFRINVENEDIILNFSHIAYESKIINYSAFKDSNALFNIEMKEVFLQLDDIVVTSMKCDYSLSDVPVYTQIISNNNIEESGAISIGELLEQTLGISKKYDSHGSFEYNLSGLDSKYILVLKNGKPVNGRFNDKLDLDHIAVSGVEKVEITKGPGSSLYGSEAMGGVINIITGKEINKQKINFQLRNNFYSPNIKNFFSGSKGNVISINLVQPLKNIALQSSILYQTLTDNSLYNPLAKDEVNKLNMNGQLDWKSKNDMANVVIKFSYFDQLDSAHQITSTGIKVSSDATNINRKEIFIEHTHDINDKITFSQSFNNSFYTRRYYQSGIDETFLRDNIAKESLIDYETKFEFNLREHLLIGGFEYSEPGYNNARLKDTSHIKILRGFFVQDQYAFLEKLNFTIGLRADQYDQKTVFNPRIATLFKPNRQFRYRLSYGQGFRAPSIQETFIDFYNVDQGYMVTGNPSLEPEKSRGFNFNLEFSNNKSFRFNTLAYINNFSNKILVQQTLNNADLTTMFTYENISKATYVGLELFADLILDSRSTINVNLNLRDNRDSDWDWYSFRRGEILQNTIPFSAGFRYIKNFQTNKIKLIINQSINYRNEDDIIRAQLQGYGDQKQYFQIVDFKISKSLSRQFNLNLGVKNIGDYKNSFFGPFQGRLSYLEIIKQ